MEHRQRPQGRGPNIRAAELNGELETTNARSTFKRAGANLEFKVLPDSPVIELTKQ